VPGVNAMSVGVGPDLGSRVSGRNSTRYGSDPWSAIGRLLARGAGTQQRCLGFYVHRQKPNRAQMTKYLLAGVAAAVLISGVASAQVYAPAPPPPPGAVVVPAPPPPPAMVIVQPPPIAVPGTTTTTTVRPSPDGDHRETTIHREVDRKGNAVIEKDVHREGIGGSTDTHVKTETDRDGGSTTTTETTTNPR